jgi:dihydroorotate dehydrogenase
VGVAAGLDKSGDYIDALGRIGFSYIEVGTITPLAQIGNPKPRLFRLADSAAIVNRMGFNNKGAQYASQKLACSHYAGVKGVSIGKNASTPLERASEDYRECLRRLYSVAGYFAINVSSPNTENLRQLQSDWRLEQIVESLQQERLSLIRDYRRNVPLLLKIAPDLDAEAIAALARDVRRLAIDGIIATNTTVNFSGVLGVQPVHRGGGLSGAPLHSRSVEVISRLRAEVGKGFPIIGVGGIDSPKAALETLDAGADLIQIYTGMVYRGPRLFHEILEALAKRHANSGGLETSPNTSLERTRNR